MLQAIADRLEVKLDAEIRERVADEQLRMVWMHATAATLVATVFAVLMALHFGKTIDPQLAYGWMATKIAVAACRVAQGQIYRRSGFAGGRTWRAATYGMLAVDGAVWGAAAFYLMDWQPTTVSLAIASFVGIACVATFGFQVSRIATAAYVVPIIVPMILGLLVRQDALGLYCSVALGLLLMQMLITAVRSDSKLSEVFLLRIHAANISAERTEALELAQRQSAAKSQFLGTVSHELRTPIHGILGAARLVHVESADAVVKKRMELIEGSGTHLLGLVTDLIDVSRVQSGQMRIQKIPFDLSAEIERVADIYSLRAADKGLSFTFDSQLQSRTWVSGDPVRLRQVLHNLLGNAIKFTEKGWIHLMACQGAALGEVCFEIRDTGIGIKEEDQKLVFNAFQQVMPRLEGRREGTGLGLTIAHEIAQLLDGGITLRSKPGFGSVFEFVARFEPATEPPFHARQADGVAGNGAEASARILLVEDNDVNALIAGAMLANQGHHVEHAADGEEAVRRALREIDRPDLVLMDCMMPIMDGFDATRSIRAQEAAMGLARVPIIALSAIIDEENGRRAIAAGMNDSLGKPFSNDELRAVMRPWLALRDSERQGALADLRRREIS